MSNQDKIYFSKQEYNKLMQIINDKLWLRLIFLKIMLILLSLI